MLVLLGLRSMLLLLLRLHLLRGMVVLLNMSEDRALGEAANVERLRSILLLKLLLLLLLWWCSLCCWFV